MEPAAEAQIESCAEPYEAYALMALVHDDSMVDDMAHHVAGPEDGDGAGAGRGGGGGRAVEPPPPLPLHCDVTHDAKLSQALVTAELSAAHVVALEMADVLKEAQ